jgi:hypothetical protein
MNDGLRVSIKLWVGINIILSPLVVAMAVTGGLGVLLLAELWLAVTILGIGWLLDAFD